MIKETPQISPQELAVQLNIPQGEAIIILDEIRVKQPVIEATSDKSSKTTVDRSLLEFNK